jgi:hypothetical protein
MHPSVQVRTFAWSVAPMTMAFVAVLASSSVAAARNVDNINVPLPSENDAFHIIVEANGQPEAGVNGMALNTQGTALATDTSDSDGSIDFHGLKRGTTVKFAFDFPTGQADGFLAKSASLVPTEQDAWGWKVAPTVTNLPTLNDVPHLSVTGRLTAKPGGAALPGLLVSMIPLTATGKPQLLPFPYQTVATDDTGTFFFDADIWNEHYGILEQDPNTTNPHERQSGWINKNAFGSIFAPPINVAVNVNLTVNAPVPEGVHLDAIAKSGSGSPLCAAIFATPHVTFPISVYPSASNCGEDDLNGLTPGGTYAFGVLPFNTSHFFNGCWNGHTFTTTSPCPIVTFPTHSTSATIKPTPNHPIQGQLLGQNLPGGPFVPIVGAPIDAYDADGLFAGNTFTTKNGKFALYPSTPHKHKVFIGHAFGGHTEDGFIKVGAHGNLTANESNATQFDPAKSLSGIVLKSSVGLSICGKITDTHGNPVAFAQVTAVPTDLTVTLTFTAFTGSDGTYCVDGLYGSTYVVEVLAPAGSDLNGGYYGPGGYTANRANATVIDTRGT